MRRLCLRRLLPILAAAGALALIAAAPAAAVRNGVYQGVVNGTPTTCGSNEGEGFFRVSHSNLGSVEHVFLSRPGTFTFAGPCGAFERRIETIVAPSFGFKCNQYNVAIPNDRLKHRRIDAGRDPAPRFDWEGNLPIGPNGSRRHVRFKGAFDAAAGRWKGFTRVTSKSGCDSGRMRWTMKRVGR